MWFPHLLSSQFSIPVTLSEKINNFQIDSRKIKEGALFFAIKGAKVDGHNFLQEVAAKGAQAVVVSENYRGENFGLHLIKVTNVQETLQTLAKKLIEEWEPIIIAITGSIGKTSTKDFIVTLLGNKHSLTHTEGNQNTQLSLPLTILNAREKTRYLVLEMGMDMPGELDRLISIAPPSIAVLTMLAHSHIERFITFENLVREKLKIFKHHKTRVGFYNYDMPFKELVRKKGVKNKISYSLKDPKAHFYLKREGTKNIIYKNGSKYLEFLNRFYDFSSLYNLLAAIAVAEYLRTSKIEIEQSIKKVEMPKGRMEKIEKRGITFINDSYNANVPSVLNALQALDQFSNRRKIVVLSEMVEQGQYSYQNHKTISTEALKHSDCFIGLGEQLKVMVPLCREQQKEWAFFLSFERLDSYLKKYLRRGDVVLVKGANKYKLDRIIYDFNSY